MQALSSYRPRISIPVVYPLLILPYSSTQTVPPLTSPHSIIHLKEPLALHYLPSPANETMAICEYMAAGKNRKSHWVQGSPNTDIRTESEDMVALLKRSKRSASWAQQTCIYQRTFLNLPSLLLHPPLIHAGGKSEACRGTQENSLLRETTTP